MTLCCVEIGIDYDPYYDCYHHHHLHVHHHDHHLYRIDPEEKDIEAAIEGEPDQVQGEEVKVQTDHAEGSFFVVVEENRRF